MSKLVKMLGSLVLLAVIGFGVVAECVAAENVDRPHGVQAGSRVGRL